MEKEKTNAEKVTEGELSLGYRNKSDVFKGGILGFFIGLAIIVPGVSGAAVSIIFGLYEKLLFAMGNLFKKFKQVIFQRKIKINIAKLCINLLQLIRV